MSVPAASEPQPQRRPQRRPQRPVVGRRGAACHLALVGDVSGVRVTRLEAELAGVVAGVERVVVNMSRVTHLGLDALRALDRTRAAVAARGGQFQVNAASAAATLALARAGLRWGRDAAPLG